MQFSNAEKRNHSNRNNYPNNSSRYHQNKHGGQNFIQDRITNRLREIDQEIQSKSREATRLRKRSEIFENQDRNTEDDYEIRIPDSIPDFLSPISKKRNPRSKMKMSGQTTNTGQSTFRERKQLQTAIENVEKELKNIVNEQGKLHQQLLTSVDDFTRSDTPETNDFPQRNKNILNEQKKRRDLLQNKKKKRERDKQDSFLQSLMVTDFPIQTNDIIVDEENSPSESERKMENEDFESEDDNETDDDKNLFPGRQVRKDRKKQNYLFFAQRYRERSKNLEKKNRKLRSTLRRQHEELIQRKREFRKKKKEALALRQQMSVMYQKISQKYEKQIEGLSSQKEEQWKDERKKGNFQIDQLKYHLSLKEKQLNELRNKLFESEDDEDDYKITFGSDDDDEEEEEEDGDGNLMFGGKNPKKKKRIRERKKMNRTAYEDLVETKTEELIQSLYSSHRDIYSSSLESQRIIKNLMKEKTKTKIKSKRKKRNVVDDDDEEEDSEESEFNENLGNNEVQKLFKMNKEIMSKLEGLTKSKKDIDSLRKTNFNHKLQESSRRLEDEKENLKKNYERKINSLKAQNSALKQENEGIREDSHITKTDLEDALSARDTQSTRAEQLLRDLSSRDRQIRQLESKNRVQGEKFEKIRAEITTLKNDVSLRGRAQNSENSKLKMEIRKQRTLMRRAEESLKRCALDTTRWKEDLQNRTFEIQQLRENEKLSESEVSKISKEMDKYRSRNDKLKNQISQLKIREGELEREARTMKRELKTARDLMSSARSELTSKVGEMKDGSMQLLSKNKSLSKNVERQKKQAEALTVQYQILELKSSEKLESLETENEELRNQLRELNLESERQKEEIGRTLEKYELTVGKLDDALTQLRMTSEKGGHTVELLQGRLDALREKNAVVEEKNKLLVGENEIRANELENVRRKCEERVRSLERDIQQRVVAKQNVQRKLGALDGRFKEFKEDRRKWHHEKSVYMEKIKLMEKKNEASLERMKVQHKQVLSRLGGQVRAKFRISRSGIKDLLISTKQEIHRLSSDVLYTGFEKIIDKVQVFREEAKEKGDRIDELQEKIMEINDERRADLESQEKNLKMFTFQIEKLNTDLSQKSEECRLLEQLFINEGKK